MKYTNKIGTHIAFLDSVIFIKQSKQFSLLWRFLHNKKESPIPLVTGSDRKVIWDKSAFKKKDNTVVSYFRQWMWSRQIEIEVQLPEIECKHTTGADSASGLMYASNPFTSSFINVLTQWNADTVIEIMIIWEIISCCTLRCPVTIPPKSVASFIHTHISISKSKMRWAGAPLGKSQLMHCRIKICGVMVHMWGDFCRVFCSKLLVG